MITYTTEPNRHIHRTRMVLLRLKGIRAGITLSYLVISTSIVRLS